MEELKFLIYFCICVGRVGCQMTTDTCTRRPGVKLNATSIEKFITSPGFPEDYANNLNCYWIIRNTASCGLRIDVKFIELEWKYDTLRFRYGSAGITEVNVITTSEHVLPSESVTIWFTSDGSTTHSGFKLSYSITGCRKITDTCTGRSSVKLNATSTEQFITSPGFPDNYADNLNCYWIIRNTAVCGLIRIDVKYIAFEWMFDKLRFRYGSAGITEVNVNTTSEHVLPSESVTIRFTSDESHSLRGFKLSYSITGCTCVSTSGLDVKATYTRKYITSPGFPRAYHHNTMCRWNIATSTACTLLRLETIVVETEDRLDTPTIKYDGGLREKISNKTYYIPSNRSVLLFKTDGSVSKRGFNMSYQAEDLHIAKNSSVFGCKDSQLLAEAKSKYVFSSNYPENSMDTDCNWMIFAAEPCTTTGTVNGSRFSIVVEEFKSNGSSPIAIFQETEHQSDDTLLIALASTICIVCIVTVIVHIVVRLYCRKRSSQTKPSDNVKFHNEGKVKTKRPYVDMGIRDHSENGNQQETRSTGDIYEDVSNAEDLGANKQDYYYIETPGAENEQHSDMYINTDTINVDHEPSVSIRNDGDEDVYEEIDIPSTSRLNS